jgi:hypothetical protein
MPYLLVPWILAVPAFIALSVAVRAWARRDPELSRGLCRALAVGWIVCALMLVAIVATTFDAHTMECRAGNLGWGWTDNGCALKAPAGLLRFAGGAVAGFVVTLVALLPSGYRWLARGARP